MKILYHHRVASQDGQFVHIKEIIRALENDGHAVSVVGPSVSESSEFGSDGGFVSKLKKALPKSFYEIAEMGYGLIIAGKLIKTILKERPDVIYERYNLYQPVGVFLAKVFKLPILLEVNAPLKLEREKYSNGLAFPKLAKWVENYTWKNSSYCLPVSDVLAGHLKEAKVKPENIKVIHNGIREENLENKLDTKKSDVITVGFVGFMHLTCGVEWAMEVVAELKNKNVKIICVGDGDIIPFLKSRAESLGIENQIEFTGLVNRQEVMGYVDKFDIALQPDVTDYASPLKMFEYMSKKCLIVAPRKDNIQEIIDDSNAVLFENSKDGFKSALLNTLINYSELEYKKELVFNRLSAGGFTWESNARKIVELSKVVK